MGALRNEMIEEMKLRDFSPRTEQSYVSAMVGLVKCYHQSLDQLHSRADSHLSVASPRAGPFPKPLEYAKYSGCSF